MQGKHMRDDDESERKDNEREAERKRERADETLGKQRRDQQSKVK